MMTYANDLALGEELHDRPVLRLLQDEDIIQIHDGGLRLLRETGVVIRDRDVVARLSGSGARVQIQSGAARVTIPSDLVVQSLTKAPSSVTLYDRLGEEAMVLGSGRFHARSSSGATAVFDLATGEPREPTSIDAANAVRVADLLPNVQGVSTMAVQPADVPPSTVDVHTVRIALLNTLKPLGHVCLNEDLIEPVLSMVAATVGGDAHLTARPTLTALAESTSPLQYVSSQMAVLRAFASRRLPLTLHAHPMAGLTAPVTLAGELVVTHAEVLALVTMAQLVHPGTPVVYGMSSSVPDMRTAANLSGAPEIGLMGSAVAQLAQHCGLPCVMSSGSDAHLPGAQSVMERLMTLLPPALAGVDLVNLSTLETKMSFSLEQLVIDDLVVSMVQRYLRGIGVGEQTLALDVIQQIGPGGTFVSADHTFQHYRDELFTSALLEHHPRAMSPAGGAQNLVARARERVEELLERHEPPPLPPDVIKELDAIVEEVKRRNGSA